MCNSKNKPHKHADLIKAWADGAVIQFFSPSLERWCDCLQNTPEWVVDTQYRIKPEQPDIEKYGVESGDIWRTEGSCLRVVGCSNNFDIYGSTIKARLNTLLFRRGVVNKLGEV